MTTSDQWPYTSSSSYVFYDIYIFDRKNNLIEIDKPVEPDLAPPLFSIESELNDSGFGLGLVRIPEYTSTPVSSLGIGNPKLGKYRVDPSILATDS